MFQTGYKGITTLGKNLPFNGGFCRWYYVEREKIDSWPAIDPKTQMLRAEPALVPDASWYGPVRVPDYELGFEEPINRGKPGISYKQKVYGVYPGDSAGSRVNLENLPWHEFIVVGKMRAGGLFLIMGTAAGGMQFDPDYASGAGRDNAGAKIAFTIDSLFKALILPVFSGEPAIPPPDGQGEGTGPGGAGGGGIGGANDYEIIFFNNVPQVTIPWTLDFKNRFGIFPLIEVWFDMGGPPERANIPILVDQEPPNTTLFTIEFGGPATGFVIIK